MTKGVSTELLFTALQSERFISAIIIPLTIIAPPITPHRPIFSFSHHQAITAAETGIEFDHIRVQTRARTARAWKRMMLYARPMLTADLKESPAGHASMTG